MAGRRTPTRKAAGFAQMPKVPDAKTQRALDVINQAVLDLQARRHLELFTATEDGYVPASGGSATDFLSADGTWKTVVGSGAVDSVTGTSPITVSPTTGNVVVSLDNNGVSDAKLRDSAGISVIGRSAGTVGDPADIAATTDGDVLRVAGGVLGFGAVPYGSITFAGTNNVLAKFSGTTIADSTITDTGALVTVANAMRVTGNFDVNTSKFTVAAATGNTLVAGTLDATGNFAVNTDKFTVAAATGNTLVAGTLTVSDSQDFARGSGVNGTAIFRGTSFNSHFNFPTTGSIEETYIRGGKSGSSVLLNDTHNGNVSMAAGGGLTGVGTTTPRGELSVASSNTGSGFVISAWDNKYSIFGPNVGSTTGAALGLGYSTTDSASNIISLQPGTAWRKLRLGSAGLDFYTSNGVQAGGMSSAGVFTWNADSVLGSSSSHTTKVVGSLSIGNTAVTPLYSFHGEKNFNGSNAGYFFNTTNGTAAQANFGVSRTTGLTDDFMTWGITAPLFSAPYGHVAYFQAQGAPFKIGTLDANSISLFTNGIANLRMTIDSAGAASFASTLEVTGNFTVNTNKFTVTASSGNTAVAGTLGVTGDFAVNTNKFTVTAANGNTLVAGTLGVTGDFAVNTNKFTVAAASGNTVVAGTLNVASTGAFGATVTIAGQANQNSLVVYNSATGQTLTDSQVIHANSNGTYDCTAATRYANGVVALADATKSAGAFNLENYGIYAEAQNGDKNYGGYFYAVPGANNWAVFADGKIETNDDLVVGGDVTLGNSTSGDSHTINGATSATSAHTVTQDTLILERTGTGLTIADVTVVRVGQNSTPSFDCTATGRFYAAGVFVASATKSAGANPLGNTGVYCEAGSGGDSNYALYAYQGGGAGNYAVFCDGKFGVSGDAAICDAAGDTLSFHGAGGATQQTVTGSRGGNAALADLLTKLATLGLIVDGTSA